MPFVGFVLPRRGAESFVGATRQNREHIVTLRGGVAIARAMGADTRVAPWRVVLAFGMGRAQQGLNLDLDQPMAMRRPTEANRGLFGGHLAATSMHILTFVAMLAMRSAQRLLRLSEVDPPTGRASCRVFERELQRAWQRRQRGARGSDAGARTGARSS